METNTLYEESYYGKLPEFDEMEKLFDAVIAKARKEKNKANPNKYPEMDKIQKIFCKLFGFKNMYLYWIPSNQNNAFTVAIYSLMLKGESKDFIEKRSDKGFYDTSGRSVLTVYGYCGLLSEDTGITSRELIAIILHEIGHNFDYSPYHLIDYVMNCILTCGYTSYETKQNSLIEDLNDIKMDYLNQLKKRNDEIYDDQKKRDKYDEEMQKLYEKYYNPGKLKSFFKMIKGCIAIIGCIPISIPIQIFNLGGKKGELFADSFAASYGYGIDLSTGLDKISRWTGKIKDTSRTANFFRDFNNCLSEILYGMIEIHGTYQERCKETINKLYSDLNSSDYPAGMKDALESEIKKLEGYYRKIITASPDDRYRITKRWRKFCDIFFKGAPNIAKWFKPNRV